MICELSFRCSTKLEKVSPKPYLFDVSLMVALSDDLLHCISLFALLMLSQPN